MEYLCAVATRYALMIGLGFEFRQVTVSSDTSVIADTAEYTFIYERFHNNFFVETAWKT